MTTRPRRKALAAVASALVCSANAMAQPQGIGPDWQFPKAGDLSFPKATELVFPKPASRLFAAGYGKQRPIASNTKPDGSDDPQGRQKNRRVEIKFDK